MVALLLLLVVRLHLQLVLHGEKHHGLRLQIGQLVGLVDAIDRGLRLEDATPRSVHRLVGESGGGAVRNQRVHALRLRLCQDVRLGEFIRIDPPKLTAFIVARGLLLMFAHDWSRSGAGPPLHRLHRKGSDLRHRLELLNQAFGECRAQTAMGFPSSREMRVGAASVVVGRCLTALASEELGLDLLAKDLRLFVGVVIGERVAFFAKLATLDFAEYLLDRVLVDGLLAVGGAD